MYPPFALPLTFIIYAHLADLTAHILDNLDKSRGRARLQIY